MSVSGKGAVAAYSMISTLGNVCYSFGSGIAAVALMLASMFYNEEDKTALRSLIKTITYYALVINAVVMLALFLLAPMLVDVFFNGDETTREITVFGLKLFSLSLVPCALNTTLKNYYQGINRTPVTLTISALQNFILTAAFAAILGLTFGTTGVWLGFVCGETTTLIVIVIISWINNKKISFSVTSLSMLPDDFGANDEDCFEASVTSMEEAVLVSQKASDFCQERGEEQRFGWMIALCIEEMTTNIVKHGFKADGKEHSIDIKLVLKQQERVIRIRDNCINFDPIDYVKLHGDDNSLSRVGIKMVMALVKDANYVNSFGLNNLTLSL
jgi:anti-sigma regulatory factor (Ser/Thr protein kinase)